jgi:hypothetical protein
MALERLEVPSEALEEIKRNIQSAKRMVITLADSESFRNVVPVLLEEVGKVEGEESLSVEGSAGSLKAYPLGNKTLLISLKEETLEIVIADVPFERMRSFLKGEEDYEVDESAGVPEEGEEEEEFEPE